MFQNINLVDVIFQLIGFGLIFFFIFSFSLLIRRLLLNSSTKKNQLQEIDEKLDRVITLLEEDKKDF